ncbi:hypothetical protein AAHE18_07G099100 [Arachis hypogaea]|nr:uncharacterized protein DS421_7g210800 [Arachis hypogaea]
MRGICSAISGECRTKGKTSISQFLQKTSISENCQILPPDPELPCSRSFYSNTILHIRTFHTDFVIEASTSVHAHRTMLKQPWIKQSNSHQLCEVSSSMKRRETKGNKSREN